MLILQEYRYFLKKNIFYLVFFCTFLIFNVAALAQIKKDTVQINQNRVDTLSVKVSKKFKPAQAALYSAVLPGLGQAYNKKYWKIPLIYAGAVGLGYFIKLNNEFHLEFKDSFNAKINNKPEDDPFPNRSIENINLNKRYWQRNRDYLIIISTVVYSLNIVDALVDAHLKDFDVGDNLTLKIEPHIDQFNQQAFGGLSLVLKFK